MFEFGDKVKKAQRAAERKNKNALLRLMKDESYAVQIAAIKGLGKAGDKSCYPALLAALKDPDFEVRAAAAEALGNIGDADIRTKLFERLPEEKNDYVRQSIHTAIKTLQ